jgi:aspartate racemase
MKTIGLIGGMSWESSQEYYRIINETARARLGGLHSAQSLMFSFDFAEIEELQHAGNWEEATRRMVRAAQMLEQGGAEFVLICTNTMHKMAKDVQDGISVPLIHIADPTGEAIKAQGITKIGLLGTKYTMEHDFYKGRLVDEFGLKVIIPDKEDRQVVHDIIYDELCLGKIREASRKKYLEVIRKFGEQGAQGVILGCTEIGLLVQQADTSLPIFDTTRIHAEAAVTLALQQ